jgi:hypothetical protein
MNVDRLETRGGALAAAIESRTGQITEALRTLDNEALASSSRLEGWSRLTIACHLRYGAEALLRMTRAAIDGTPTSYYPAGREQERPATLVPRLGELGPDVVSSLAARSGELTRIWSTLSEDDWRLDGCEPGDTIDPRPLSLAELALLRLTECEVHGSDLAVALDGWSDLFVSLGLPFRVERLRFRNLDQPPVHGCPSGSWLLIATDGPTYLVSVTDGRVDVQQSAVSTPATAVIEAASRDLLAVLLGRPPVGRIALSGDLPFAHSFSRAFPGP